LKTSSGQDIAHTVNAFWSETSFLKDWSFWRCWACPNTFENLINPDGWTGVEAKGSFTFRIWKPIQIQKLRNLPEITSVYYWIVRFEIASMRGITATHVQCTAESYCKDQDLVKVNFLTS